MKLTEMQIAAARLIGSRNAAGMGAMMPFYELIMAANELHDMGLAEYRSDDRRWLTAAGRLALKNQESDRG